MAAATGSIASCKKLQAESEEGAQQQFYALVVTNAQQQTFDLAVTDGEHAWRGTGKHNPAHPLSCTSSCFTFGK
jgi:hypothetical protein